MRPYIITSETERGERYEVYVDEELMTITTTYEKALSWVQWFSKMFT